MGNQKANETEPWFIAVERFRRSDNESWRSYIEWSGLEQLEEVISLDSMLCPNVFTTIPDSGWEHIAQDSDIYGIFNNLEYLRQQIEYKNDKRYRILCVFKEPQELPRLPPELDGFEFCGFDLIESETCISALNNCGGWPELNNNSLSKWGLLTDFDEASLLQKSLRRNHPEEAHANCDLWAIFADNL